MRSPSAADLVTLTSYGLGFWWSLDGPDWAGVVSIIADELDGQIARSMQTADEQGSALDWGADVALTPLAMWRLGRETGHAKAALIAAPGVLYAQAGLRAQGYRPPVGSARAAIMLTSMLLRAFKK